MANKFMLLLLLPLFAGGTTYIGGDGDVNVEAKGDLHISTGGNITVNGKLIDACSCCDRLAALELKLERLISSAPETTPRSCQGIYESRKHISGVYTVDPRDGQGAFKVYCDMTTDGGWTVFQRRKDGSENFYRGWADYKTGFGDLNGEFWLGLDKVHRLTGRSQEMRVDLEDFENNKKYAQYAVFSVGGESGKYELSVAQYSGNAGDAISRHNGMKFSTKDSDSDAWSGSCANEYKGAWWYEVCHDSNLNGLYMGGTHSSYANGVNWRQWKGYHYSLKFTEMKIRPPV